MKAALLTILLVAISLACCNSTLNAPDFQVVPPYVKKYHYVAQKMQYVIFFSAGGSYNQGTATVINVTKDSLECAYYRKQLAK
jgi:hypothetical protein